MNPRRPARRRTHVIITLVVVAVVGVVVWLTRPSSLLLTDRATRITPRSFRVTDYTSYAWRPDGSVLFLTMQPNGGYKLSLLQPAAGTVTPQPLPKMVANADWEPSTVSVPPGGRWVAEDDPRAPDGRRLSFTYRGALWTAAVN